MPQIIVMADTADDAQGPPVMFTERVNVSDFESHHFQTQLVQRLGWAVGDAAEVERGWAVGDADEVERESPPQRRSARVVTTAS
jgi:hypothetical protein